MQANKLSCIYWTYLTEKSDSKTINLRTLNDPNNIELSKVKLLLNLNTSMNDIYNIHSLTQPDD